MSSAMGSVRCAEPGPTIERHDGALTEPGAARRFRELRLPDDADLQHVLYDEGFGLTPSRARRADSEGGWYVTLTDGHGADRLRALGLDPVEARPDALSSRELASFFSAREAEIIPQGEELPVPGCDEIAETFCQYESEGPCEQSVSDQLLALQEADSTAFFSSIADSTYEGRSVHYLRLGGPRSEANVPQLVLVGGLRAREWAGTGLVLEMAKRLVAMRADPAEENEWLRRALDRSAVLFVPVANPDGYAYTFSARPRARDWQKNRVPSLDCNPVGGPCGDLLACSADQYCHLGSCYPRGVDLFRNFAFNWLDTGGSCASATYEGSAAGSEPEVAALTTIFVDDGISGPLPFYSTYASAFFLGYGAYGNYVLFPDGVTEGADASAHQPCRVGEWSQNCQPPELPVLRWLFGSETEPLLWGDPAGSAEPYKTDTIYRALYRTVGDPISHYTYSPSIRDFDVDQDRRALGAWVQLGSAAVGNYAECMSAEAWEALVSNQLALVRRVLENLFYLQTAEGTARPVEVGDRPGARIHRLRPDDDSSPTSYGPPRFWAEQRSDIGRMTIAPSDGFPLGVSAEWDTAGLFYRTYSWRPYDDYQFPGLLSLCPDEGPESSCDYALIDGGTPVDLCSGAMFPERTGWTFVGQTGAGRDDCYLEVTGRGEDERWDAVRMARELAPSERTQLQYSYRVDPRVFRQAGRVEVAVRSAGTDWVTVRTYPADRAGGYRELPNDRRMRTEIVDLPPEILYSFSAVQVRFRAIGIRSRVPRTRMTFRVYDVVLVGRPAPLREDAGCIDLVTVATLDPPGEGGAGDLLVVSGRDSPEICGADELGPLAMTQMESHLYQGVGGLSNGLYDSRLTYSVGGASASTDEAFLQTLGGPGPDYTVDDPLYASLWGAEYLPSWYSFDVPGILLGREPTQVLYTRGDPAEGYEIPLQFRLVMDRRVEVVDVAVWRLVRSDGVGPDVDEGVVRNWFGEQPVRLEGRVWGGMPGYETWQANLREHQIERVDDGQEILLRGQIVDEIFAQCPIEQRLQHRVISYAEWQADDEGEDRFVEEMDVNTASGGCGAAERNLADLQQTVNGPVVDDRPGVVNVYLVNELGPPGCTATAAVTETPLLGDRRVPSSVIPLVRAFEHRSEAGGRFILAHELAHADGYPRTHCGQESNPTCVPGDLMAPEVSGGGGAMSQGTCDVIRPF